MRIDKLTIQNYKGFDNWEFVFHPQFNLLAGVNGTGKTSTLEALAVAVGAFLKEMGIKPDRVIDGADVHLKYSSTENSAQWEPCYPCRIEVYGMAQNKAVEWSSTFGQQEPLPTFATSLKGLSKEKLKESLPLIAYYSTERLKSEPRESFQITDPLLFSDKEDLKRLSGYYNCLDNRLSVKQLIAWIARQSWVTFQQQNRKPAMFAAVIKAILESMEGTTDLYFDAMRGEVVVETAGVKQLFSNLSDGQRSMLAMVGDIAQKAARLNPHLGGAVLAETEGVVLIDELDLHLHPRWQRRIIENLRSTFPKIQFIATTHSPFLIQSLRSGEELILLEGQPTADLANLSLHDIAQEIMGVENPQVSQRYADMKEVARNYLELLEEASLAPEEKQAAYKEELAKGISLFADNPAFQAFLEMKREARLGK